METPVPLSYCTFLLPLIGLINPLTIFSYPMLCTLLAWFSSAFWLFIWALPYSLDLYPLFPCFWNFSIHQNHLEGLLNHKLLGPSFSYSTGLESRMKICISNKFPGGADPVDLETTLQDSLLYCYRGLLFFSLPLNVHDLDVGLPFFSLKTFSLGEFISLPGVNAYNVWLQKCLSLTDLLTSFRLGHSPVG